MDRRMPAIGHRPGLDHPHTWMLRRGGRYSCIGLGCTAESPPGWDHGRGDCAHDWLPTPNAVEACVLCGLLREEGA